MTVRLTIRTAGSVIASSSASGFCGATRSLRTAPIRRKCSPTPERIRAAVREVLDQKRYAARAAELSHEFVARDAGAISAALIEQLVRTRTPVARP